MMMEINRLPSEMLLEVHRRMTPSALKKAVLVNKLWRDVGEDPALWEWCKVAVYSKEDISNLSIRRLQQIKEILINPAEWDVDDWEAFFRAVEQFSSLKKIDGLGRGPNGLNLVEPGLFARTLAKLEDVAVKRCTYQHIEALFTEMSISTPMKRFRLWSDDLSQMESGLFARVLSRLENLQLGVSHVTEDQIQALFTEVLNNRSLKRLDLMDGNIWRYLEPGFFARVLSTVEYVSLADCGRDSGEHLQALFTKLSVGTQLKILRLYDSHLRHIEPALFANALSRLEEVRLEGSFISTRQIQALFNEMSIWTQMKKLVLVGVPRIDLRLLNPELFARVIARLEDVDLGSNLITTEQMLELFKEMSRNFHLKSLDISRLDLSPVDPEVLAKAVTRLETVTLCDLTNHQVVWLFSEMSRTTVMKKIDLYWYYSDFNLFYVDPDVLTSALVRLEEVSLRWIGITHDQAMTFFTEISRNSRLKKLDLSGGDFSRVDSEVLALAVTNVEEVDLCGCNLSTEQITNIFTHILEGENKLRKLDLRRANWPSGGAAADVNPEIVRKVEEKLKGQLRLYGRRPSIKLRDQLRTKKIFM